MGDQVRFAQYVTMSDTVAACSSVPVCSKAVHFIGFWALETPHQVFFYGQDFPSPRCTFRSFTLLARSCCRGVTQPAFAAERCSCSALHVTTVESAMRYHNAQWTWPFG